MAAYSVGAIASAEILRERSKGIDVSQTNYKKSA